MFKETDGENLKSNMIVQINKYLSRCLIIFASLHRMVEKFRTYPDACRLFHLNFRY